MSSPAVGSPAWEAQDKGHMIVTLCWTFTALGIAFVVARLFVRGVIRKGLMVDDYWSVLTVVSYLLYISILIHVIDA